MKESQSPHSIDQSILDFYYRPKPWESEKLYKTLGIKSFQKILKRNTAYRMSDHSLRDLEQLGKTSEVIHAGALFLVGSATTLEMFLKWPEAAISTTLFNVAFNLYPIMSQRYNRIRINRIKESASCVENNQNSHLS